MKSEEGRGKREEGRGKREEERFLFMMNECLAEVVIRVAIETLTDIVTMIVRVHNDLSSKFVRDRWFL